MSDDWKKSLPFPAHWLSYLSFKLIVLALRLPHCEVGVTMTRATFFAAQVLPVTDVVTARFRAARDARDPTNGKNRSPSPRIG